MPPDCGSGTVFRHIVSSNLTIHPIDLQNALDQGMPPIGETKSILRCSLKGWLTWEILSLRQQTLFLGGNANLLNKTLQDCIYYTRVSSIFFLVVLRYVSLWGFGIRNRVVAQLVVHLVWDQDVAGSSPVYPTMLQHGWSRNIQQITYFSGLICQKPLSPITVLWCNGNTSGFGPEIGGSNPSGTTKIK